jgi:hypothetical protein
MRTARMLKAEWRQVLWGSVSMGAEEDGQVLSMFGLLDCTMLWPVLTWQAFWNLRTVYFFNFLIFFRAVVNHDNWNHGYWISRYGGTPVFQKKETVTFIAALLLNIIKKLYVAILQFFCAKASDLSLIHYGSCPCILRSELRVKGDLIYLCVDLSNCMLMLYICHALDMHKNIFIST